MDCCHAGERAGLSSLAEVGGSGRGGKFVVCKSAGGIVLGDEAQREGVGGADCGSTALLTPGAFVGEEGSGLLELLKELADEEPLVSVALSGATLFRFGALISTERLLKCEGVETAEVVSEPILRFQYGTNLVPGLGASSTADNIEPSSFVGLEELDAILLPASRSTEKLFWPRKEEGRSLVLGKGLRLAEFGELGRVGGVTGGDMGFGSSLVVNGVGECSRGVRSEGTDGGEANPIAEGVRDGGMDIGRALGVGERTTARSA